MKFYSCTSESGAIILVIGLGGPGFLSCSPKKRRLGGGGGRGGGRPSNKAKEGVFKDN